LRRVAAGEEAAEVEPDIEAVVRTAERQEAMENAVATAKKKKQVKGKGKKRKSTGDSDSDNDYSEMAEALKRSKLQPGQIDHCEICGKKFTVTTYSKNGPDGGLLCSACAKDIAGETPKKRKTANRSRRVTTQSNALDGKPKGPKGLLTLAVEVSDNRQINRTSS
jgi:DNA repair protein RAD7